MTSLFPWRLWRSPPLVLQILLLLFGGLVLAQVATLFLTLVLPPEPAPQHSLDTVAAALRGDLSQDTSLDRLERSEQAGPPDLSASTWLVAEHSRNELANLLGVSPASVRLAFYTPLPFAGTSGPPPLNPEARRTPAVFSPGGRAGFQTISYSSDDQSGPGGGGPPPGGGGPSAQPGGPGGGFPGTAGGALPTAGGFPGSSGSVGSAAHNGPSGGAPVRELPNWREQAAPGSSSKPQGPLAGPPSNAAPIGPPSTAHQVQPPSPPPNGAGGINNQAPLEFHQDWQVFPTMPSPSTTDRASRGGIDADTTSSARSRASPLGSTRPEAPTVQPSTILERLQDPVVPRQAKPATPRVAPNSTDTPVIVPAVPRALFGLAPAPFVEGDFVAALRLPEGGWAIVRPIPEGFPNVWQRRVLLWFVVSFALVAPLGWLFARRIVKPLSRFAEAAEQLGRDPSSLILQLDGPAEVGRAAFAFNLMQSRLKSFVDDRTAMVGAISHDLRTPLTRLRFRIEDVDDEAVRDGMIAEVGEMEAMISSVLGFIRDASVPGVRERIDLRALIEEVTLAARLIGSDVEIESAEAAPVEVDALGMRRVLGNLVENAVKYGQCARIRLFVDADEASTEISDSGPGLPEDELEQAFEPFYRGDAARNSDKQGSGLGLAVCRSIARAHGGDVRLRNSQTGFIAELRVPLVYGSVKSLAA